MFNLTSHYGNSNQNHNRFNVTPFRTATIKRFNITPFRTATIKNQMGNKTRWWGCEGIRTFARCWWEYETVHPLRKQLRHRAVTWPTYFTPRYISKEVENGALVIYIYTPMFKAALSTPPKIWKKPKCPSTDEKITQSRIETMEYKSALKKEGLTQATAWMNFGEAMLVTEINQTQTSIPRRHPHEDLEQAARQGREQSGACQRLLMGETGTLLLLCKRFGNGRWWQLHSPVSVIYAAGLYP